MLGDSYSSHPGHPNNGSLFLMPGINAEKISHGIDRSCKRALFQIRGPLSIILIS